MNIVKKSIWFIGISAIIFIAGGATAEAAIVPTFSLVPVGSTSAQVNVTADANSSVSLNYGSSPSGTTILGTTDQNGKFSMVFGTQNYGLGCNQTAYVSVNGARSATIPWSVCQSTLSATTSLSFSQSNVQMTIGQTIGVGITGTGGYYVSNNSNPSVVTAQIGDTNLNLTALAFGGSNVTVCQSNSQCEILYVVALHGPNDASTSGSGPVLSSFSVSSNNANSAFMNAGDFLTFTFNLSAPVTTFNAAINGSAIGTSGTGAGPYTVSYNVNGTESMPIQLHISFKDDSGRTGEQTVSVGNIPVQIVQPISTPIAPISTPTIAPTTIVSSLNTVFTTLLKLNSKGSQVTALQQKLKALGFYSGPLTGTFGPLTETAVKKFQKAHGLTQAGYTGPGTRALLNK